MEAVENNRIDFIDLTKGLCIILIVMGHIGGIFNLLDTHYMVISFRLPLYFFISGVFFKSYSGFGEFLVRKINKILIPFVFFYLIAFCLMFGASKLIPGIFHLPVKFSELLLVFRGHELIRFNPPIWFLIALFNCNILFYVVHYLRNRHLALFFVFTFLFGAIGFYLGVQQMQLPLYWDVAMTAFPFYVGGFWIRRYNFFLMPHHRFDKMIPIYIIIAIMVMYFTAIPSGMRCNQYGGSIFRFYIAAFAGIFGIMLICKKFKHIPVISYIGRYSIITLSVHAPILHFAFPLFNHFIRQPYLVDICIFLFVQAICVMLTPVLLKVIPQFVANKNLFKIPINR